MGSLPSMAKSKGETLPWCECLPKGIRESKDLAAYLKERVAVYAQAAFAINNAVTTLGGNLDQ